MKVLWHNGGIYTMEREGEKVESVLVEDGRIVEAGSYIDLKGQADQFVDLAGAVMYPGFVDSHLHMIGFGLQLKSIDLSKVTSKAAMLDVLSEASRGLSADEWLVAEGFNENLFEQPDIPTAQELDEIRQGPMMISRVCRHVYLGNSGALDSVDMENYIDSEKGSVGRHEDGRMNGLLYEGAAFLLRDSRIPDGEDAYVEQLKAGLNDAIDEMLSKGLTGGHVEDMHYYGPSHYSYRTYAEVTAERQDFRCNLLIHNEVFEEVMAQNYTFNEAFMELGAMKIFADGSFGGSTAALLEDYNDQPGWKGTLIQSDEELERLFILARKHQRPIAAHTIGDAAAAQIIAMIEKYPPAMGVRDRIIHACLLNEDLLRKMAALEVVVDVQPLFMTSDFPWVSEKIGEQRLAYAYAWCSIIEAGIPCAGSSDAPVESVDPLLAIYAAVERELDGVVYVPEQRISRFQAIQLYTFGSAQAINHEQERGLIKRGYVADFSVFNQDLFEGDVRQAQAVMTVVNGKIAFQQ